MEPYIRQRSPKSWSVTYRGKEKAFRGRTKTAIMESIRKWVAAKEDKHHGIKERIERMTVRGALAKLEESARRLASWNSIKGRWEKHLLPKFGDLWMDEVSPHEVDVYLASLLKKNGGPLDFGSVNHCRNHLRRLYTWGTKKGGCWEGENPISKTDPIDLPEPEPKALTDDQLRRIVDAAGTMEDQVLLATAFLTGMRKKELRLLEKARVDMARGCIWVSKATSKSKKPRPIPIAPELRHYFERWLETTPGDLMFPGPDGKPRSADFDAAEMFRKCMVRAGLLRGWEMDCRKRKAKQPATGSRNGRAKLGDMDVEQIKARHAAGERPTDIAKTYGISRRMVGFIATGRNWSSRKGPLAVGCGWKTVVDAEPQAGELCPTCGRKVRVRPLPLNFQFRHTRSTFITRVVESTGDLRAAQLLAGHANQSTTERNYAARRVEHLRGAVESLPAVLNTRSFPADDLPMLSSGHRPSSDATSHKPPRKRRETTPSVTT